MVESSEMVGNKKQRKINSEAVMGRLFEISAVEGEKTDAIHKKAIVDAKKTAKQLELGGRFEDEDFAVGSVLELYDLLPEIEFRMEGRSPRDRIGVKYVWGEDGKEKFIKGDRHSHFVGALYIAAQATGRSFNGFIDGHYVFMDPNSDVDKVIEVLKKSISSETSHRQEMMSRTFGE